MDPQKERELQSLDSEIVKLQKSTRTTVPAMLPLHDILRHKFSWYYRWSLFKYSKAIHALILIGFLFYLGTVFYHFGFSNPGAAMASSATIDPSGDGVIQMSVTPGPSHYTAVNDANDTTYVYSNLADKVDEFTTPSVNNVFKITQVTITARAQYTNTLGYTPAGHRMWTNLVIGGSVNGSPYAFTPTNAWANYSNSWNGTWYASSKAIALRAATCDTATCGAGPWANQYTQAVSKMQGTVTYEQGPTAASATVTSDHNVTFNFTDNSTTETRYQMSGCGASCPFYTTATNPATGSPDAFTGAKAYGFTGLTANTAYTLGAASADATGVSDAANAAAVTTSNLTQTRYRIGNDDGTTPANHTWKAAENTTVTLNKGTNFRARMQFYNTGGSVVFSPTLYYSSGGAYAAVPTSCAGNAICVTNDAANAVADATLFGSANFLTSPGGTPIANGVYNDTTNGNNGLTLGNGNYIDWEYNVQMTSSAVAGTTYSFRMYFNNADNFTTYTNTLAVTAANVGISGSTNLGNGWGVRVAVNGILQAQTGGTNASTWSISGVDITSGQVVTVWVDGISDANESTAVTKYDGTGDISGMVLNSNVLTIGSTDNQSLTVTDVGKYTCANSEDVMMNVATNTLDIDTSIPGCAGSATNTYTAPVVNILASNTLTIAGTETLSAYNVGDTTNGFTGSLVATGNATFNVNGNWKNGGTFTKGTETVNFNNTGAGQTLSGSAATSFNNLTLSNTNQILSALTNFNVSGTLTVNANTTLYPSDTLVVNSAGAAGTITGSGTVRVTRIAATADYANQYKFSTNTLTNLTVVYYGTSAQSVTSTVTYGSLTVSMAGQTATAAGDLTIGGDLNVAAGTLALSTFTANRSSGGGTLTLGASSTLNIGGTNTFPSNYTTHSINASSTVNYSGTTQSVATLNSSQNYGNLTISGSGTKTLAGVVGVAGDLNVSAGTLDLSTFTANRASAGGTLTLAASTTLNIAGTGSLPSNFSTHSIDASSTINYAGTNQNVATLNSAQNYGNLNISGSGTKTLQGTVGVAGDLNISGGTYDLQSFTSNRTGAGGALTVANGAGLKIGGTGTLPSNFSAHSIGATSTIEYAGTTTTVAALNSAQSYGHLTISGSGVTTSASFTVVGNLSSTGSLIASGGSTITKNGGTISNSGTLTFLNLTISGTPSTQPSTGFSVDGTLTVNAGQTLAPTAGTITMTGGTITNSGGAATNLVFYNLTSSGAVANSTSFNVANDFKITAGTFTSSGTPTYTVSGSIDFTGGAFTKGSSTIIMNGASKTLVGNAQTLNNLQISNDTTAQTSVTSITGTLTVDNGKILTVAAIEAIQMKAGSTTTINGTIARSGAGFIDFYDTAGTNLSTGGTLSAHVYFKAEGTDAVVPARTYGGDVYLRVPAGAAAHNITLGTAGSQTINFQGALQLQTGGAGDLTVKANTYNPTVNISGDVSGTKSSTGINNLNMGSGTWTVSGNMGNGLTAPTITAGTSTLIMDGSGKQLNEPNQSFNNVQIAGIISTPGTTISMYTGGILTVNDTKTFTIAAGDTFYMNNGSTTNLNTSGTIASSGSGRLFLSDSACANLSTGGTLSATVVFYANAGDITIPARTYGGGVIISNANTRKATLDSGTHNYSSDLIITSGGGTLTVDASVTNPTVNITGNLGTNGGPTALNMGSGTWTVTGNINLSYVSCTTHIALDAGGSTVVMNAGSSGKSVTSCGHSFNNIDFANASGAWTITDDLATTGYFKITNGTVNATNRTLNIAGDFNHAGGNFTSTGSTVNLTGGAGTTQTISGSTTFNNLSATGSQARTIKYTDGTTQIVSGTWTMTGAANQLIILSGTAAAGWTINPTAATVNYADITHSNNNGLSFCATNSHDSGSNAGSTGWRISDAAACAPPTIAVPTITNNNTGTSVTFNGNITDTGGSNATERGFKLYAAADNTCSGTILMNPHDSGSYGTGAFTKNSDAPLTADTTYNYTSYAISPFGTTTSTCETFTTPTTPTVTVQAATGISATAATLHGNIASTGRTNPTERGFKIYTNDTCSSAIFQNPHENGDYSTGAYQIATTDPLAPHTDYWYTAYAINGVGTAASGTCQQFTTIDTTITMSVLAATDIAPTSATLNGTVVDTGGVNVTRRGFKLYADSAVCGGVPTKIFENGSFGAGAYSLSSGAITSNTDYSYKSYGLNSADVEVDSPTCQDFVTLAAVPSALTVSISSWDGSGNPDTVTTHSNGNPAATAYFIQAQEIAGDDADPQNTCNTVNNWFQIGGGDGWNNRADGSSFTDYRTADKYICYRAKARNKNSVETTYSSTSTVALSAPAQTSFAGVGHNGVNGHTANTTSSITWGWNGNAIAVTGYKVYYYDGASCTLDNKATTAGTSVEENSGLSANTSYARCLRAYRGAIYGQPSANFSAYTSANDPTTLGDSAITTTGISWSWGSGGAQKDYYASDSTGNSGYIAGTSWNAANGHTANTQYTLSVYTRNGDNDQNAPVTTNKYTAIETPTGITAVADSNSQITLSVTNSLTGLNVGSSGIQFGETSNHTNGGGQACFSGWTQTNSCVDSGLLTNVQYTYNVVARNGDGVSTNTFSSQSKYTKAVAPGAQTVREMSWDVAKGNSTTVTLDGLGNPEIGNGQNPQGTEYKIEFDTHPDPGDRTYENSVENFAFHSPADSVDHDHLTADTTYYYRTKARNGDGEETAYNDGGIASVLTVPAKPTFSAQLNTYAPAAEITTSSIHWYWEANAVSLDGYYVKRDNGVSLGQSVDTNYNQGTLDANTSYGVKVEGYRHASWVDANVVGEPSDVKSAYTAIEPVSAVAWDTFTTTSLSAAPVNALSHLNLGSSGIQYCNTTTSNCSAWQQNQDTWVSDSLDVNVQYTLSIQSRNGDSRTTATASASKYTRANPPSVPSHSAIGTDSVTWTWNTNANPAGTEFYATDGSGVNSGWVANANSWDSTAVAKTPNTQYLAQIYARNGDQVVTSDISATAYTAIETPQTINVGLKTPNSLALTMADSLTNLNAGSSGIEFVETSGNPGGGGEAAFTSFVTNPATTDASLFHGTTYKYKVKARNAEGVETALSPEFSFVTTTGTELLFRLPGQSIAQAPDNKLSYTDATPSRVVVDEPFSLPIYAADAANYRDNDSTDTLTLSSSDAAAILPPASPDTQMTGGLVTVTVTMKTVGTQTISGVGSGGSSVEFLVVAGLCDSGLSTAVANPTSLSIGQTSTVAITLKDSNNNPLAGHAISVTSNQASDQITFSSPTTDADGKIYAFVTSEAAHISTITVADTTDEVTLNDQPQITFNQTAIAPPTNFRVNAGDGKVDLFWNNPVAANFSSINIYRSTTLGELGNKIQATAAETFTDQGLTNGTIYFYTLKSLSTQQTESVPTEQLSARPMGASTDNEPPSAPTNLRATAIGATTLTIAWDRSTDNVGVAGYQVFNAETQIMVGVTRELLFSFANLTPETVYRFYVRAYDAAGNFSDFSNILPVKTLKSGTDVQEIAQFMILSNVPDEIEVNDHFSNVRVTVADSGGKLISDYIKPVYFDSSDDHAQLPNSKNKPYVFTAADAGTHQFDDKFQFKTVGKQTLSVSDGNLIGSKEVDVTSKKTFQDMASKVRDFFDKPENVSKVNTGVVATSAIVLLAPIVVNSIVSASTILPQLLYWFFQFLQMVGVRRKSKPWGIVYNSQTGQALSLAVVKIFEKRYNRMLERTVTDNQGRYGFLAKPGEFYMTVSKAGFKFPPKDKSSSFYEKIYSGGEFKITESDQSIAFNVPMDPVVNKWFAGSIFVVLIRINKILQRLRIPLLVVGTTFATVMTITSYNLVYLLSLLFYAFVICLEILRTKKARPYGMITDIFGHPIDLAIVRIYHKNTNRLVETDVSDVQGRFKFLVNPGVYYITAAKVGFVDYKSHLMYLEKEKTMVSSTIKLKKLESTEE